MAVWYFRKLKDRFCLWAYGKSGSLLRTIPEDCPIPVRIALLIYLCENIAFRYLCASVAIYLQSLWKWAVWYLLDILRREIKIRLNPQKITIALILQGFFLFLIFVLLTAAKLSDALKAIFLAETGLILLAAPLLTSSVVNSGSKRQNAQQLLASPLTTTEILIGKLIGSEFYNLIFLALSFLISSVVTTIFWKGISFLTILDIHIILLIYLYSCGALGMLCSAICRSAFYATELAYSILAILISNVVLIEPLIRWKCNPSIMIPLALHTNPFVSISMALKHDIFRTVYLYNLSPVASYGYIYPKWYLIGFWYVLGGGMCFLISACLFRRQK